MQNTSILSHSIPANSLPLTIILLHAKDYTSKCCMKLNKNVVVF